MDESAPAPEEVQLSPAERQAVLAMRSRERVDLCTRELFELLARHRCRLKCDVILSESGVTPMVNVVPVD